MKDIIRLGSPIVMLILLGAFILQVRLTNRWQKEAILEGVAISEAIKVEAGCADLVMKLSRENARISQQLEKYVKGGVAYQ